jgi:tRNA-Thr(GGU) m(6)t(6)A37 methyltransferase TsaA
MGILDRLRRGRARHGTVTEWPDPIHITPIGIVRSRLRDLRYRDVSGLSATIEVFEAFVPALLELDGFSHAVVLSWLDRVSDDERRILRKHTAGPGMPPEIGVLALRTHHRPNPIGCTVVRIEQVHGPMIEVVGLDVIDGTPILDVKPYLPAFDSVADARLPGWAAGPCDNDDV